MIPLVDAHCHIGTRAKYELVSDEEVQNEGTKRCIVSCNQIDLPILMGMKRSDEKLIIGFGVHPWYSHMFSLDPHCTDKRTHYLNVLQCRDEFKPDMDSLIELLPDPINLEGYIEKYFKGNPDMFDVIGEIGLDKLFWLPENGYYMEQEVDKPRYKLSKVKVQLSHQISVFTRLCQLANQYDKPISVHDVKCYAALYEICCQELLHNEKVNICLHSYTGSVEMLLSQWFKKFPNNRIYVSISQVINFREKHKGSKSSENLLLSIPQSSILTETDYPVDISAYSLNELDDQLMQVCGAITSTLSLDDIDVCKSNIYNNFLSYVNQS
ncbi:hypothetical protein NCAS_0C00580 [Naumovozyma castellii]|uniref:Uncharacterized protein n=1 Tax=Naumovozyma castellii TaxID=27288 RepID=G0VC41_NAUCA|nr:hypothetical protein NCAS_0C00580 [Naumovozyma castellii CBS 4309]CCC69048.1 hypothetical protein NCAS_0C00580 [Naumovozyma castellii CBS 4309]